MDPQEGHYIEREMPTGAMKFSEFISSLELMEVEYCRVDLLENRITFSIQNGDLLEDHLDLENNNVANKFDDGGIRDAIMLNHQSELTFLEFVAKLLESGVVSYTVYPVGKRTIYFGRHGDSYYENIRSAPSGAQLRGPGSLMAQ